MAMPGGPETVMPGAAISPGPGMMPGDPEAGMMGPPAPGGPMGPGPVQPPGPPPIPEIIDPIGDFWALLKQVIDEQGEEAASQVLQVMDDQMIERIRTGLSRNPEWLLEFDALLDLEHTVEYPKWFKPPPKPTEGEMLTLIGDDEGMWSRTRDRIYGDLRIYHQEHRAVFNDFNIKENEDRAYLSTTASDEARAVIAMIGSIDPNYEIPWMDPVHEDDTQLLENALYHWDRQSHQEYTNAGNGEYKMDVAHYLVITGYVVSQQYLNLDGDEPLFCERLLSPENTFPSWDDHGLRRLTRNYYDTIANVIADFSDYGSDIKKKLLKRSKVVYNADKKRDESVEYQLEDRVSVKVYCDRWWFAVLVDDELIVGPVAHRYGFVPYVVRGSGVGEPAGIVSPPNQHIELPAAGPGWPAPPQSNAAAGNERQHYKNVSWFHFRRNLNEYKEQVISDLMATLRFATDPAWLIEQDELAEVSGEELAEYKPGAKLKAKLGHERVQMLLTSPAVQSLFGPALQQIIQDEAANAMPKSFFGLFESANQSGNAMEGAYESGRDKVTPFVTALSAYYSERAAMRLKMIRDWGYMVPSEGAPSGYGEFVVPMPKINRKSGPSARLVSKETVKRAGTLVFADLRHIRLQNLGPLGNAVSIWMHQNAMSAREAIELRGHPDPDAVFRQIRYEKALLDEDVQKAITLAELAKSDPNVAAIVEGLKAQSGGPGGGGGGGMMPPPGAGFGGGPTQPPGPGTSAIDLPSMGMGPMGPTGRPPGSGSPSPPQGL
jgi:hypothetical protein